MGLPVLLRGGARDIVENMNGIAAHVTLASLHLYTSNVTPAFDNVAGDFTELVTAGYAAVALVPATWVPTDADEDYRIAYPNVTFTFAAYAGTPILVRGYYVLDNGGQATVARSFEPPYTIPNAGGSVLVQPNYRQSN